MLIVDLKIGHPHTYLEVLNSVGVYRISPEKCKSGNPDTIRRCLRRALQMVFGIVQKLAGARKKFKFSAFPRITHNSTGRTLLLFHFLKIQLARNRSKSTFLSGTPGMSACLGNFLTNN